jgi:hypothetical protein
MQESAKDLARRSSLVRAVSARPRSRGRPASGSSSTIGSTSAAAGAQGSTSGGRSVMLHHRAGLAIVLGPRPGGSDPGGDRRRRLRDLRPGVRHQLSGREGPAPRARGAVRGLPRRIWLASAITAARGRDRCDRGGCRRLTHVRPRRRFHHS